MFKNVFLCHSLHIGWCFFCSLFLLSTPIGSVFGRFCNIIVCLSQCSRLFQAKIISCLLFRVAFVAFFASSAIFHSKFMELNDAYLIAKEKRTTTACCLLFLTLKKWFLTNLFNLLPLFIVSLLVFPMALFREKGWKTSTPGSEMMLKGNLKWLNWKRLLVLVIRTREEIAIIPQER